MMNAIQALTTGVALVRQESATAGHGILRIETALTTIHSQITSVVEKVGRLEMDMTLKVAEVKMDVAGVKSDLKRIDERYATTKYIVYGLAALILTTVFVAFLAQIMKSNVPTP